MKGKGKKKDAVIKRSRAREKKVQYGQIMNLREEELWKKCPTLITGLDRRERREVVKRFPCRVKLKSSSSSSSRF